MKRGCQSLVEVENTSHRRIAVGAEANGREIE